MQELIKRAKELLADGTVVRVLGWKAGDLAFNPEPAYFETPESLEDFVYDGFCGANLSKYMIEASKLEGKTMVCLKPCDTYSFNQLLKEHRVDREKAYIVGVGCKGKLDIEKIRKMGIKGIRGISGAEITGDAETLTVDTVYGEKTCAYKDAMLERCHVCKGKEHKIYDELIGESKETKDADRFAEVERIEAMSPEEKFAFWQSELSKCIRCNACRNVCPACSCRKCVFDSNKFDSAQKANVDSFEEKMFHVIRAFHVAGRCTDCGDRHPGGPARSETAGSHRWERPGNQGRRYGSGLPNRGHSARWSPSFLRLSVVNRPDESRLELRQKQELRKKWGRGWSAAGSACGGGTHHCSR